MLTPKRNTLDCGALYKDQAPHTKLNKCDCCFGAPSVGLPAQERRDVQQILRIGVRTEPVTHRALTLNRRLIESCIVAARHRRPTHNPHRRLATRRGFTMRMSLT